MHRGFIQTPLPPSSSIAVCTVIVIQQKRVQSREFRKQHHVGAWDWLSVNRDSQNQVWKRSQAALVECSVKRSDQWSLVQGRFLPLKPKRTFAATSSGHRSLFIVVNKVRRLKTPYSSSITSFLLVILIRSSQMCVFSSQMCVFLPQDHRASALSRNSNAIVPVAK